MGSESYSHTNNLLGELQARLESISKPEQRIQNEKHIGDIVGLASALGRRMAHAGHGVRDGTTHMTHEAMLDKAHKMMREAPKTTDTHPLVAKGQFEPNLANAMQRFYQ